MKKHLDSLEKKEYIYYIGLLSSCVNSTEPPLPYDGINWKNILHISSLTRTEAMLSDSVFRLPDASKPDSEILERLLNIRNQAVFIDGIIEFEIEKVLAQFEKHKIRNAPVKGYFLKREYPQSYLRSVGDFDILFDISQLDELKTAFSEIGYEFVGAYDGEYQFIFEKKPFMYIEMHASLVRNYEKSYPCLAKQLDNAVRRDGYRFSRMLTAEDHYAYLNVHSSNHYRICGMGMRMVLDEYVYYKNHCGEFESDYLQKRLKECGVDVFEKRVRSIAFKWFSPGSVITDFDDVETYIILSAIFGRGDVNLMVGLERSREKDVKAGIKKSKAHYFLISVFPPRKRMQEAYPYLEKYPFLLPYTWVNKWFRRLFIEKDVNIKNGLKKRLGYNEDDVEYYKSLQAEMGFDTFGVFDII